VQRFQEGAVRKDECQANAEIECNHNPREPRESNNGGQNPAGLEFLAKAKAAPLRSGYGSSNNPEHPNDKQADEFPAESRNEIILHTLVNSANDEDCPSYRHYGGDQELDDVRVIEIPSSVQRISTGEMIGVVEPTDSKAKDDE